MRPLAPVTRIFISLVQGSPCPLAELQTTRDSCSRSRINTSETAYAAAQSRAPKCYRFVGFVPKHFSSAGQTQYGKLPSAIRLKPERSTGRRNIIHPHPHAVPTFPLLDVELMDGIRAPCCRLTITYVSELGRQRLEYIGVSLGSILGWRMNQDFYKQQAERVRDLADKTDPFTKRACWIWQTSTTSRPASLPGHCG
jgi:hypothetical protein